MLASVTSAAEARVAVRTGADIVDLKNPAAGALGALPWETVREGVAAVGGARLVSATIGDLPMDPAAVLAAAAKMGETGVDYVKVGLFAGPRRADCVAGLGPLCAAGTRIVIVMFADQAPDFSLLPLIADAGCAGVMLDTAGKRAGGLRDFMGDRDLAVFVEAARNGELLSGLAGSLTPADIPHLLPLEPDVLGFRGALCTGAARTAALDPAAVRRVRALIPRVDAVLKPRSAGLAVAFG
jgi:dihydroneopterin aldolase